LKPRGEKNSKDKRTSTTKITSEGRKAKLKKKKAK